MPQSGDLISTSEAARILRKSTRTVHRMARDGQLPAVKLGEATRSWVFERGAVEAVAKGSA